MWLTCILTWQSVMTFRPAATVEITIVSQFVNNWCLHVYMYYIKDQTTMYTGVVNYVLYDRGMICASINKLTQFVPLIIRDIVDSQFVTCVVM